MAPASPTGWLSTCCAAIAGSSRPTPPKRLPKKSARGSQEVGMEAGRGRPGPSPSAGGQGRRPRAGAVEPRSGQSKGVRNTPPAQLERRSAAPARARPRRPPLDRQGLRGVSRCFWRKTSATPASFCSRPTAPAIARRGSTNPIPGRSRSSRCPATTASSMVRSVLRAERLVDLVTQEIVAKADGNPFFLEQLALHAGRGAGSALGPAGAEHDPRCRDGADRSPAGGNKTSCCRPPQ